MMMSEIWVYFSHDVSIVLTEERHAELCYAECLFMRALLTFIQVCASTACALSKL